MPLKDKEARAAYQRAYRAANVEKFRAYEEKRGEYMQAYREANREKINSRYKLRRDYFKLPHVVAAQAAYRKANPEIFRRGSKEWIKRNPEKTKAHRELSRAIRSKEVIKPDDCSRCGKLGRIEAHHPDYSKPLEVIWLCRPCHGSEHRSQI